MLTNYLTKENERQGLLDALGSAVDSMIQGNTQHDEYDWNVEDKVGYSAVLIGNEAIVIEICAKHDMLGASGKAAWVNNKKIVNEDIEKPCVKLDYCPYGQLVEVFPLSHPHTKYSCVEANGAIIPFGHDCPAHYHAELVE